MGNMFGELRIFVRSGVALLLSAALLGLSGCASTPQSQAQKEPVDCSKADNVSWVAGGGECLRIITDNPKPNQDTLIILIHGDTSRGGPSDYFVRPARNLLKASQNKFVVVSMIRPGYHDSANNYSSGTNYKRRDSYTRHNITAMGEAIQALKLHYQPKQTLLVGQSGGAAMSAVMMDLFPGIAETVLLAGCPCHIPRWRQHNQGRPFTRSLSPHKHMDAIDKSTRVVAVVGENDTNTTPYFSEAYVKALKEKGIDASVEIIPGQAHHDLAFRSQIYDIMHRLVKP